MFEQAIKNFDDVLWKEAGCGGEDVSHRSSQEIINEIAALDAASAEVMANIRALL